MASQTTRTAMRGTLLLADISGYTAFLQSVGVAHGDEMTKSGVVPEAYPLMTALLDGIVARLVPPFSLSKTEGDAVFAFADDEGFQLRGDAILECIDACYAAFRDDLRALEDSLTCGCNACNLGVKLDLKFVMHHGGYVVQPIAGRHELLGPDVNAVHRLLKNHVADTLGDRAYALFTSSAADYLGVPAGGSFSVTERYEHFAPIEAMVFAVPINS